MSLHPLSRIGHFALPRLTLLLNHIVSSEPVAMAKLQAHAGRTIDIRWVSSFAPSLPFFSKPSTQAAWAPDPWRFVITRAGLFEMIPVEPTSASPASDVLVSGGNPSVGGLTITVQLEDPLTMARKALTGTRPEVNIEGDAALAEVASWMMKNLRWDVQDDVARWLGTAPAEILRRVGEGIRQTLQRWRPPGQDNKPSGFHPGRH